MSSKTLIHVPSHVGTLIHQVASVLGDQICAEWVLAIHPMHSTKDLSSFDAVNEQLDQLCQMNLLVQHKERMDFYRFDSAMLREVTYELIPHGQRMALHAKFARYARERCKLSLPVDFQVLYGSLPYLFSPLLCFIES